MENKNMRSSVNVVLMALLFGLVCQAMADDPSSFTCFDPKPSEKISIDKLLSVLGSKFYTYNYLVNGYVFEKLESTKGKEQASTILGQYSVQQLLDFNTWTMADCTGEALEKRRQQCISFCSHEETYKIDPPNDLNEVDRQEAFTKHNLGGYCWVIVEKIQDTCPFLELDIQLSKNNLDRVWNLFLKTRHLVYSDPNLSFNSEKTKKRLSKYLAKKEPSEAAELWGHCSTVVGNFDTPRPYSYRMPTLWHQFVQFCREFIDGFTPDGHNRDEPQQVEPKAGSSLSRSIFNWNRRSSDRQ